MYARDEALIATPIGGVRLLGVGRYLSAIRIEPETREEIVPTTGTEATLPATKMAAQS